MCCSNETRKGQEEATWNETSEGCPMCGFVKIPIPHGSVVSEFLSEVNADQTF